MVEIIVQVGEKELHATAGRGELFVEHDVLLAALLGYIGVRKVKQVRAPERAIEQGREIPNALKGKA